MNLTPVGTRLKAFGVEDGFPPFVVMLKCPWYDLFAIGKKKRGN